MGNFKPSDYFKSMEDIEIWLEQMKIISTPEQYDVLRIAMGLGEQEGEYKEVEGIGKIDKSIVDFIITVNEYGFKTLASCSGIEEEHPKGFSKRDGYVAFLYNENQCNILKEIAESVGAIYSEGEVYLQPSSTIRVPGETDTEKRIRWGKLLAKIQETIE